MTSSRSLLFLRESLSVLVLQVGVIQDNVGFAESLSRFRFVLFCFVFSFCCCVFFFFLFLPARRSPRPSTKSNWLCNEEGNLAAGEKRFDGQGGVSRFGVGVGGGQRSALSSRNFKCKSGTFTLSYFAVPGSSLHCHKSFFDG